MNIHIQLEEIDKKQDAILNLLQELHNSGVVGNKDKVYDFNDLEKLLHVSRRTIFKWKSEGRLNVSKIGKKLYVTESELNRFLESNKNVSL